MENALRIQRELHAGFKDSQFQKKLAALETAHTKGSDEFLAARAALFLTVQGVVLPKYGFEASQNGIVDMLTAAAKFNSNEEYADNRDKLNRLLGLLPPAAAKPNGAKSLEQVRLDNTLSRIAQTGRGLESRLREKSGIAGGSALAAATARARRPQHSLDAEEEAEPRERSESPPPLISTDDIEVTVTEAFGEDSLAVTVAGNATFKDIREAISKQIGRTDILSKGHLVKKIDEKFKPYRNDELIGDEREVVLLSYKIKSDGAGIKSEDVE